MVARRSLLAVLILALVATPIAAAGTQQSLPADPDAESIAATNATDSSTVADTHPPDPEEDVLGWENGYWYNETIDVTPDDGLNDSELEAVVARGMARVEQIRRIEFEETPPVEVISRDEFATEVENETANTTEADRLHQNVKYEALLMVNESTDAVDVQGDNQAGGVGGYYDPSTGEIKIVSENVETPQMNEITLSQELFHALQDQQFNVSSYNQSTRELHNARDGIIEGDGNYVDHLYQERCENEWEGTCIMPEEESTPSDFEPHLGLYQIQLQPYSDGPPFVESIREEGGWDAVNEIYEDPPASTEQTIHPEKYSEDDPTNVSVPDRSDDDWRILELNESINYASFGEAGLYVTLWYPSYELAQSGVPGGIISAQDHINYGPEGGVEEFDPYNYNHTYTAGWDGDKLVPYVTNESSETNETGYVYKTVWDSPDEAAEFRDAYRDLLDLRNAEPVDGHEDTFRIPDDEEFGDAFYLNRTGDRFTIVNAPSVGELSAVREGAAPETTDGDGPTTDGSDATDSPGSPAEGTDVTTTDGPGFTLGVTLLVLATLAMAVGRRSR